MVAVTQASQNDKNWLFRSDHASDFGVTMPLL